MAGYILALDQGTTSSRAIVFDAAAGVRAVAQKELAQHYPHPGWVEQDPREIWSSQVSVAAEALSRAGVSAHEIAAIGIANQRETTLVWDRRTGEPVTNAIVWQDRRTARFCEGLKRQGLEPLFESRTGLVIDPYFSGSKVRWILDQVPGTRQAAESGEISRSGPWTAGSCGSSRAASAMSRTRAMRRAPSCTTSTPGPGTKSSSESLAFRVRCCQRSCPPAARSR